MSLKTYQESSDLSVGVLGLQEANTRRMRPNSMPTQTVRLDPIGKKESSLVDKKQISIWEKVQSGTKEFAALGVDLTNAYKRLGLSMPETGVGPSSFGVDNRMILQSMRALAAPVMLTTPVMNQMAPMARPQNDWREQTRQEGAQLLAAANEERVLILQRSVLKRLQELWEERLVAVS